MTFLTVIVYLTSDEEEVHFLEREEYVSDAGQDGRTVATPSLLDAAPEHDVQDLTLQPDPEVRQVVRFSAHL